MNLLILGLEYLIAMNLILIAGLICLGTGYFIKSERNHLLRMIGLFLFGVFWVLLTPYFVAIGDIFNAIICLLALPFYAFLGYHEYLSHIRNEEIASLKWIVGASFLAGGAYFLMDMIPIVSGYLILAVAYNTVWLINIFGYNYGVGDINYVGNQEWFRTNFNEIKVSVDGSSVAIIQSCTAIQSMLIFVAAIYFVQANSRRKWYAFAATVPVIYVLNLIRNVGVIYMMDTLGWSYQVAHHEIGRTGSLIALVVLAAVTFKLLPELLDNIWGLIELKDRDKVEEEEEEESKEGEGDEKEEELKEEQLELEEEIEVEKTPIQAG